MNENKSVITTWEIIQLVVMMSIIRLLSGTAWVLACTLDWIYSMLPKNNNSFETFRDEILVPIGLFLALVIAICAQSC